jgi:hypothetical protein
LIDSRDVLFLPRASVSPDLSLKPSGITLDFPSPFHVLIDAMEQHDVTIVNSSLGITRFQLIGNRGESRVSQ